MRMTVPVFVACLVVAALSQVSDKVQIDPQTGRAVGAPQMSPDELKKHIDGKTKVLIVDVREADAFQKETIKGAVHIPLADLEARLQDIPKDTTLVFT